jgi:hypothetical protein
MLWRQEPQQVPAPVRRATSLTVLAPPSMARAMSRSLTELQTQTIIGLDTENRIQQQQRQDPPTKIVMPALRCGEAPSK